VDKFAVGSADAARMHRNADMVAGRRGRLDVNQSQRTISSVNVNGAMRGHDSVSC
jgi:hypothetical protein